MKKLGLMFLLGSAVATSGCATLFSEGQARVNVTTSNSKKVEVMVDDQTYTVPAVVELKKDGSTKVIKTADASCAPTTAVNKKLEVVTLINVFSTTGFTTDAATGKMWTYQDNVTINCE